MIVALAGGVGGGRMAAGLAAVLPPKELAIVVNTGDDFEHMGFTICPDLDSVMYAVAGVNNPQTGWGRAGETWQFIEEIKRLGGEGWFNLGDRDLAVHVLRREGLRRGMTLSQVTRELCARFGIKHAILPMSDTPVRTQVKTPSKTLSFQDYFVRLRCKPRVTGFRFAGARNARVPAALQRVIDRGRVAGVVLCPSNPFVSIAPILSVPAIRAWLSPARARRFPVTAVSPLVGGAAVKGPAAKMMREMGMRPSVLALVEHYGDSVDRWVIDRQDAPFAAAIERLGRRVLIADTLITHRAKSAALAKQVVYFAL